MLIRQRALVCADRALFVVGYHLFQRYDLISKFKINESKLQNFLQSIEQGYGVHGNPYHNSIHGQ